MKRAEQTYDEVIERLNHRLDLAERMNEVEMMSDSDLIPIEDL